ncbi:MAG: hypothetical protein H5U40_12370 [Polyangiaceae bacterium]|nr:hypothetical protein [Polyangiaceae bacterium]
MAGWSKLAARGFAQVDIARAHAAQVADEAASASEDKILRFSAQLERALDMIEPSGRRPPEPSVRQA